LLALTSDHAWAVNLPANGTWRLTLTLVEADLDTATMTSTVTLSSRSVLVSGSASLLI